MFSNKVSPLFNYELTFYKVPRVKPAFWQGRIRRILILQRSRLIPLSGIRQGLPSPLTRRLARERRRGKKKTSVLVSWIWLKAQSGCTRRGLLKVITRHSIIFTKSCQGVGGGLDKRFMALENGRLESLILALARLFWLI